MCIVNLMATNSLFRTRLCDHVYQCFGIKYYLCLQYRNLRLAWLRFFRAFSSVVRQMPGYNPQRRGTTRTLPNFLCCSIYCFCVILCTVCVQMCTVLLPPGGYPIAVNKYIISYIKIKVVYFFDVLLFTYQTIRCHSVNLHSCKTVKTCHRCSYLLLM
jgi:hypothetical protein